MVTMKTAATMRIRRRRPALVESLASREEAQVSHGAYSNPTLNGFSLQSRVLRKG